MSDFDFNAWKIERATGTIEEYVKGTKKKASDINWVLGVLMGNFGVSKEEALMVIDQLKKDTTYVRDSNRLKRLEELEKSCQASSWTPKKSRKKLRG